MMTRQIAFARGHCANKPTWRSRTRPRTLGAVALSLLMLLSGCASLDAFAPRTPSYAMKASPKALLGQAAAGHQSKHPGQSGFDLLVTGQDALQARIALADAAEHTLDLQYYSVAEDPTTDLLLERILSAAKRGVRVRILLDDIEVSTRAFALRALAAEASIQVRIFHPFFTRRWLGVGRILEFLVDGERLNRRMHNKLWVADNVMAIFGSRNLGDAYFDANGTGNFSDLDLIAAGPVVTALSDGFDEYWNSKSAIPLVANSEQVFEKKLDGCGDKTLCSTNACCSAGANDYLRRVQAADISFMWGTADVFYDKPDAPKVMPAYGIHHGMIDEAVGETSTESELLFISPYFIPSGDGLEHLRDMRRRGVRIAVLTNSLASTDAPAAHAGYARHRTALLARGVELFELRPEPGGAHPKLHLWGRASASSLHAKVIVINRVRVIVGSMNQDPRSRLYNTESWVSINSPELAARVASLFEESTQAHHSFSLQLRGDGVEWITEEQGKEVRYKSDPLASKWQRFLNGVTSVLIPEDLL